MRKNVISLQHVLNSGRYTANARSQWGERFTIWKMLTVLACLLFPIQALGDVLPNGSYLVQMADSDMAVVTSGLKIRERVSLRKDTSQGIWRIAHLGNDYYRVNAKAMRMVLDSSESKKYNGVPIISFPWHGGKNQRWKLIRKGPFFSFINQATGLALDLKDNIQKAGNVFQGYTANESRGQLFRLTPVEQIKKQEQPKNKEEERQQRQDQEGVKEFSNSPHPNTH